MAVTIASSTSGNGSGSNSTTQNFSVPSGVVAGDLLLIVCSGFNTGLTFSFPSGWVQIANSSLTDVTGAAFYKVSTGSEGSSVTATLNKDDFLGYVFMRITGQSSTTAPESAAATGSTGTPNSPSLNPAGFGTESTLWITSGSYGFKTNATSITAPSGFTYVGGGGLNFGCPCMVASVVQSLASKDPEAWTVTPNPSGGNWVGLTIAVRPSSAPSGISSIGDVAVASISTVSGTALASISSVY